MEKERARKENDRIMDVNQRADYYTCIKYFLENIDTEEYQEYKDVRDKERHKNHIEYLKQEHPKWLERDDYYEDDDAVITNVILTDRLSNDGVAKLIDRLYSLPESDYKVTNYYRKSNMLRTYDYVKLQYSRSSVGRFAEVDFLNDKYIDRLEISWTQINSVYAFIEYIFWFKKCLDAKAHKNFLIDNIRKIDPDKDYADYYYINEKRDRDYYLALEQMEEELMPRILQHFITSILYSEQGKYFPLINFTVLTREKEIEIDRLYLSDFGLSYYNKNENYVISVDSERTDYVLFAGGRRIPNFWLAGMINRYGNGLYNFIYGEKQLKAIENRFSKYFNDRKTAKYNKELIMLLNVLESLSPVENRNRDDFCDKFNENWFFYIGNEIKNFGEFVSDTKRDYKTVYDNLFSFLKMKSDISNAVSTKWISLASAFFAAAAFAISLISM